MTWVHRLIASSLVAGIAALGGLGWLGTPVFPERFEAKTIVVRPEGTNGLRITEYIDFDTGSTKRRGFFRELPLAYGIPQDIVGTSPNAPADLEIIWLVNAVKIRIGNPDITIRGRFRYVLEYTLPEANLEGGRLNLDVVGVEDTLSTERITVYLTGMRLASGVCTTGQSRSLDLCDIGADPVGYVATASLKPGQGMFVGGRVAELIDPLPVLEPSLLPPRQYPATWYRALILAAVAALALGAMWWWSARRGRNEVTGVSASDAAFSTGMGTRKVTDAQLERLATLEVSPPPSLTPWEGAVLLREAVDDSTIEAWFGYAEAKGRIELSELRQRLVITDRPDAPRLTPNEEVVLRCLFGDGSTRFEVKGYDERFANAWENIRIHQLQVVKQAGWWRGSVGNHSGRVHPAIMGGALAALFGVLAPGVVGWHAVTNPAEGVTAIGRLPVAVAVVAGVALLVGWILYSRLRAARTALGSALALRTMSFRRFLAESEGRHVEEAWKRGVLREYSAWAVALGEADTWRRAAGAASVPVEAVTTVATTSLLFDHHRDFATARSSPRADAGGSSGGGSFGSVGSGGGGGRSGSW
jgi:hypothetical protein